MKKEPRGEIVIYQTKGGKTALEVKLEKETVWLNLNQMADLFERDKSVISRHIRNIYEETELVPNSTVAKYATVQKEGERFIEREIDFYNLDVIISVGYRVKSQRGTQFRIWATQVLKDHILKGYSINEKCLQEQNTRLLELQKTVSLLQRVMVGRELARDEATGLLQVITDYSYALSLLDQYDRRQLKIRHITKEMLFILTYDAARRAIDKLGEQSEEKRTIRCIIRSGKGSIVQRFSWCDLPDF
ncbi:MAG: RhuM family protein [Desulfobacterales bacterium]|nr:RhuM family protein [Desulfobacterales bacterium]